MTMSLEIFGGQKRGVKRKDFLETAAKTEGISSSH
jgi:hypothetical protein